MTRANWTWVLTAMAVAWIATPSRAENLLQRFFRANNIGWSDGYHTYSRRSQSPGLADPYGQTKFPRQPQHSLAPRPPLAPRPESAPTPQVPPQPDPPGLLPAPGLPGDYSSSARSQGVNDSSFSHSSSLLKYRSISR